MRCVPRRGRYIPFMNSTDRSSDSPHARNLPSNSRYSPFRELLRVRFLEFLREPEAVFWTFLFPLLLAGGLGIAFRSRPAEVVPVAVVGADARSVLVSLTADSSISVTQLSDTEARRALRLGKVAIVVDAQGPARVQYLLDDTRPDARQARLLVDRAIQRGAGASIPVATSERIVVEPGSRYIDFVVPGLLGMNLMGSGIWSIGFAIVDARRKKLLKRLVATPMRRSHYLASFLGMRLTLMVVEVTVIAGCGHWIFGVPLNGPFAALLVTALLATCAFGSLGLLIASRAKTVEAASGMMNVVMLPMWVASGVFFASSRFPDLIQPAVQALPLTATVDALRLNMLQGAGFVALRGELLILAAWLLVSFVLALKLFRWR